MKCKKAKKRAESEKWLVRVRSNVYVCVLVSFCRVNECGCPCTTSKDPDCKCVFFSMVLLQPRPVSRLELRHVTNCVRSFWILWTAFVTIEAEKL